MSPQGIKDRIAIIGMSCTKFAEHFDKGLDDLLKEAALKACRSAHVELSDIEAYWFGTAQSAMSGIALARAIGVGDKPITRVENFCATGSEALRNASYAVASGAYDIAMAIGGEKVKDSGYQGVNAAAIPDDGTGRTVTAAAMYSMIGPAYAKKYNVDVDELKRVLARIASKNHFNGARNPLAQFRKEASVDQICAMPPVAGMLGLFDCSGVADGAAAAIVVRAEDAYRYTDDPLYIKALSFVAGDGSGLLDPTYDFTTFPEIVTCVENAYSASRNHRPSGGASDGRSPRLLSRPPSLCSWKTSSSPTAVKHGPTSVKDSFDLHGELPVNPDGGLKSFGHPVGASGLRMHYEAWLQLRNVAGEERQIDSSRGKALIHNLGGYPGEMVSFVSIVGINPG